MESRQSLLSGLGVRIPSLVFRTGTLKEFRRQADVKCKGAETSLAYQAKLSNQKKDFQYIISQHLVRVVVNSSATRYVATFLVRPFVWERVVFLFI